MGKREGYAPSTLNPSWRPRKYQWSQLLSASNNGTEPRRTNSDGEGESFVLTGWRVCPAWRASRGATRQGDSQEARTLGLANPRLWLCHPARRESVLPGQ